MSVGSNRLLEIQESRDPGLTLVQLAPARRRGGRATATLEQTFGV